MSTIKQFTYSELYPIYRAEKNFSVGIYMWLHEYCQKYANDHPEFKTVKLKMIGEDVGSLEGKEYTFKREVSPADVKLRVNRD